LTSESFEPIMLIPLAVIFFVAILVCGYLLSRKVN
jgi:hypothetical protein